MTTTVRALNRRLRFDDVLAPLVVVALMATAATAAFGGVFVDWSFLIASFAGAVGASIAVLVARRFDLLLGEALAASLGLFVVLGVLVATGFPTPSALQTFFRGLVNGWSELLSAPAPADVTGEFRVVPYTLAWAGTAIGGEVIRSRRALPLAAVGPVVAASLSIMFSLERRAVALSAGAILIAGAVVLVLMHNHFRADDTHVTEGTTTEGPGRLSGAALAAAVVVAVVALAPVVGPRLPLADQNDRYDLRRFSTPPFSALDAPTPLVQLKASLLEERADDVVFTVRSTDRPSRWSTAALTTYDGVVWLVADPDRLGDEEFEPVGVEFPAPPVDAFGSNGLPETVRATVTIGDLALEDTPSFWLPSPGWGRAVEGAADVDIRMNLGSGTLAVPTQVREGMSYVIDAAPITELDSVEVSELSFLTENRATELELLPPQVKNRHADVVEGVDFGWPSIERLQEFFVVGGFYDKGDATPPGHSYARIGRFLEDEELIVGYEELYAATSGVMARLSQLPARVSVGYVIPDDRWADNTAEVRADDATAWLEVRSVEHGWIAVDVTPPRTQTPDEQDNSVSFEDVAIPNPPPPPPPPPDRQEIEEEEEEEQEEEDDEEDEEEEKQDLVGSLALRIGLGMGGVVLALGLFFGGVVLAKWRRARRRRLAESPAQSVAGAWAELQDRFEEAGLKRSRDATPREAVSSYLKSSENPNQLEQPLNLLLDDVDRAAYHADAPDQSLADDAWNRHDSAVEVLLSERTLAQRCKLRLDPKPVFRRDLVRSGSTEKDGQR